MAIEIPFCPRLVYGSPIPRQHPPNLRTTAEEPIGQCLVQSESVRDGEVSVTERRLVPTVA